MIRRGGPRWWTVFSSGSYFTIWSWLLTLPFAVTVMGGYTEARNLGELIGGFFVALVVHVFVGAIILIAGLAERHAASAPLRVLVVAIALPSIWTLRPFGISQLTILLGLPPYPVSFLERVGTNAIMGTVAFTAIAVAVMFLSQRRAVLAALGRVAGALENQRTAGIELVAIASTEVAHAARQLSASWLAVASAASAEQVVQRLRNLSTTARDLSHGLTLPAIVSVGAADARPGRPTQLAPPRPGLAITLYCLSIVPYGIINLTPAQIVLCLGINFAVGFTAEWLMRRFISGPRRTWLVLGTAAVSAIVMITATTPITGPRWSWMLEWAAYVCFVILCAWSSEVTAQLRREEVELRERLAIYSADEIDGRRRADAVLARARSILHTDIQGESLRLATVGASGDRIDTSDLELSIETLSAAAQTSSAPARSEIESVMDAWGHALQLQLTASPAAWNALADEAISNVVVDALSEAFTNVLKHADAPTAAVDLGSVDGVFVATVTSPGRLSRSARGRGLDDLRERCERVVLGEADGSVTLTIEVGARVPAL